MQQRKAIPIENSPFQLLNPGKLLPAHYNLDQVFTHRQFGGTGPNLAHYDQGIVLVGKALSSEHPALIGSVLCWQFGHSPLALIPPANVGSPLVTIAPNSRLPPREQGEYSAPSPGHHSCNLPLNAVYLWLVPCLRTAMPDAFFVPTMTTSLFPW